MNTMRLKQVGLAVLLLTLGLIFRPGKLLAQQSNEIPPFNITLADGRYFSAAQIAKDRPVVLIYFAPDCDHCHTLMNAFFKKAANFRSAEVIMVTYKPVAEVAAFVRAFGAANYSHIKVGTEGSSNFLRLFYKLQSTPFTALYDKNRKLVKAYRKNTPVDELLKELKRL